MNTRGQKARDPAVSRTPEEASELWRALEAGLTDLLPGLEILDRDLVFDEGGRADLAVVDAVGRLFLVLLAEDLNRTPLEVLDVMSFARRHASLFAHHFHARVAADLEPRVLVVTPTVDERLTLRLAPLLGHGLELFGVRTLASRSGERSYLVPLEPAQTATEVVSLRGEEAFLEALPTDLRALAARTIERLGRLDDELELSAQRDTLSWNLRGEVLVRIERTGGGLRASVRPHAERLVLASDAALEALLEEVLARLVQHLGRDEPPPPPPPRSARGREPAAEAAPTPGGRLDDDEPLLTPEEIEAFRD